MLAWMRGLIAAVCFLAVSIPAVCDAAEGSEGFPNSVKCNVDYTAAYMSMLKDGSGSCPPSISCTTDCQDKIDKVVASCPGKVFNEPVEGKNITVSRSFLWRAIQTLSNAGPVDCNYTAGYEGCHQDCTMSTITGGAGVSDYEANHCIDVDPDSQQSKPEAVWHS